jgi:hypothetical protein
MLFNPRIAVVAALVLATAACSGKAEETGSAYVTPQSVAGPDQNAIRGDTITLDGTPSVVGEGYELAYSWTFEEIPLESGMDDTDFGGTNGTSNAATISFTPDVIGTYVVSLTVTDGVTTAARDMVVVNVTSNNLAPVADAGRDVEGTVGGLVHLEGDASFDPDGTITEFDWRIASAPAGTALSGTDLYDRTSAEPSFVPDAAGVWVISLRVFDGLVWSPDDYVAVAVDTDDLPPIADAGVSTTLPPCAGDELTLDGAGSYDPEGSPLTYEWAVSAVPAGSAATNAWFDDATSRNPSFTWDEPGVYTFTLQVSDGELVSPKDLVNIDVANPATNQLPVPNAGMAQSVTETSDCRNEAGVTVCDPCTDLEFELDGTGSYDPDGDALTYRWTLSDGIEAMLPDAPWTLVQVPPMPSATGAGIVTVVDVTLDVADCGGVESQTIQVTVTCKGSL